MFQQAYQIAKKYSKDHNLDLETTCRVVFNNILTLNFINNDSIKAEIKKLAKDSNKSSSHKHSRDKPVWLIIGETGMGKSSFINGLCKCTVAKEGEDYSSETSKVEIYETSDFILIDTPGLFETREIYSESQILSIINQGVINILDYSSKIDCVFLVWSPTASRRFRGDVIIEEAKGLFGPSIIDSTILLINKDATDWTDTHDKLVSLFLEQRDTKMPYIIQDVKSLSSKNISAIKDQAHKIPEFNVRQFEDYRLNKFSKLFSKMQKEIEAEKKRIEEEKQKKIEEEKRIHAEKERQRKIQLERAERERQREIERQREEAERFRRQIEAKEEEDRRRAEIHRKELERLEEERREKERREREQKEREEREQRAQRERERVTFYDTPMSTQLVYHPFYGLIRIQTPQPQIRFHTSYGFYPY